MADESAMQLHCRAGCPCNGDIPKLNHSSQGPKATQVCNKKAQCLKGMQQCSNTLEAQTCTTKRQLQGRGAGGRHQCGDQAKGVPKVYNELPKNLHSATSAQINQPKSWRMVTTSPGAKPTQKSVWWPKNPQWESCNEQGSKEPCTSRKTMPNTMQLPCTTTRQFSATSARKKSTQTSQRSKTMIQQSFQGGGHWPCKTRSQKQGKTYVNTSLAAPDARLTQRSTTAAAAKQHTQTTPRAGDTQAKANQTTARKPKTHPCNNMHNYKRKHAADPERRARRKSSKERSQTTRQPYLVSPRGLQQGPRR
jgi:hypothetical protein